MSPVPIGISGLAAYLPPYRVRLEDWCRWTGDAWSKVSAVVGESFRMRGPAENAYTMAATAVLRLIEQYEVDPERVGFLGLGTESSTDNSAGAVIVKGMVNDALTTRGKQKLSRRCEVPEFKHACLGGVYALKSAARYLALDGASRLAIVVCADIAEYARGTSGEVTQGAGAVAMLLETQPKLLSLDIAASGSASDYRGPDFRKPFARFARQPVPESGQLRDFPVFNGKYSVTCYLDEVLCAFEDLFGKVNEPRADLIRNAAAIFLHRPYQRMAETGLAVSYLYALATGTAEDRQRLAHHAHAAELDPASVVDELTRRADVFALLRAGERADDALPLTGQLLRSFREHAEFRDVVSSKLRLGAGAMRACGNLYTASLPAWFAAALEEAAGSGERLDGARMLAIGYGSGDAAEVIPMQVVSGWERAARRIGFSRSLEGAGDVDQNDYVRLHEGNEPAARVPQRAGTFAIDGVGGFAARIDDSGIESYRFVAT